jgi:hypothetical protein
MRKPVTFRFDSDLLERARRRAMADNRTLTNYVETAILRALQQAESVLGRSVNNNFDDRPEEEGRNR